MTEDKRARWLVFGLALVLSLTIATSPVLPCIDLPQHLALSSLLSRLWAGDAAAAASFRLNPHTHNAGFHLLVALLSRLLSTELSGRLLLALYPPLLLLGLHRLLTRLGLPAWRALLAAPAILGFSFGWGFCNFCLASALAWLALGQLAAQLERPRPLGALGLALISVATGVTHVMAMLLLAITAAAMGFERLVRRGEGLAGLVRVTLAGTPLLAGCAYDLWVLSGHLATDSGSYTTAGWQPEEPGPLRKLALLGTLVSGLLGTFADTALAWASIALLLAMGAFALWERAPPGPLAAPAPLVSPVFIHLGLYLVVPSVFLNTHLVYPRLAQWALLSAVVAIPPLRAEREASFARLGLAAAALTALLVPLHFAVYARETAAPSRLLASIPPGARATGVLDDARTLSVRMPTLTHIAALQVARGGLDDAFCFARFLGLPVVYGPSPRAAYPDPSWEHDGRRYDPASPLARRFPWVLVRTAWAREPDGLLRSRLFGAGEGRVRMVAREGGWAVFDTRGLGE